MSEVAAPMHPTLGRLLRWWQSRPGQPPAWNPDLVQELKPWLGNLLVVRFIPGQAPFFSLYGTHLTRCTGYDMTGKPLTEAMRQPGGEAMGVAYHSVKDSGAPYWSRNLMTPAGQDPVHYQRLLLPFTCRDGGARILACFHFESALKKVAIKGTKSLCLLVEQTVT